MVVNTVTFEPVRVFGTVALTYFALCWPLSLLAGYATRRLDARQGSDIGAIFRRHARHRRAHGRFRSTWQG